MGGERGMTQGGGDDAVGGGMLMPQAICDFPFVNLQVTVLTGSSAVLKTVYRLLVVSRVKNCVPLIGSLAGLNCILYYLPSSLDGGAGSRTTIGQHQSGCGPAQHVFTVTEKKIVNFLSMCCCGFIMKV